MGIGLNVMGSSGYFHKISIWITKAVYLNFLWIVFTLIGLVLFGAGPSFLALITVVRQQIRQEKEISIFSSYLIAYKSNLIKGNILFFFYSILCILIYFDFKYFSQFDGFLYDILTSIFIVLGLFLLLAISYIGPVFSHFEMPLFQHIKVSFILPFILPLESFMIMVSLFLSILLFSFLPGLLPFLCISLPVYIITFFSLKGFSKWSKRMGIEDRTV